MKKRYIDYSFFFFFYRFYDHPRKIRENEGSQQFEPKIFNKLEN